jgi:DNA replication protein
MNEVVFNTLKNKDFIIKNYVFRVALELDLSIQELILLIFFLNQEEPTFNIRLIKSQTFLKEEDAMAAFQRLQGIGLIEVQVVKTAEGLYKEIVSLDNLIKQVTTEITSTHKKDKKNDIYTKFEQEFGRTLSPLELEMINKWLSDGNDPDFIIEALKEAVYNGAKSLNYINKIIHNWRTKGYKTVQDVKKGMKQETELEKTKELFYYNYLDEEQ